MNAADTPSPDLLAMLTLTRLSVVGNDEILRRTVLIDALKQAHQIGVENAEQVYWTSKYKAPSWAL